MPKIKPLLLILLASLIGYNAIAQNKRYALAVHLADKDTAYTLQYLGIPSTFAGRAEAEKYLSTLPQSLQSRGFVLASIDSMTLGENGASILLFVGKQYQWIKLEHSGVDVRVLEKVGFSSKDYSATPINFTQYQSLQQKLINHYANSGYPFAKVYLDSIRLAEYRISATLKVEPMYKSVIDSIHVIGKASVNRRFLQNYLQIKRGADYDASKLAEVDKKMSELQFISVVKPSEVSMAGGTATLNLFIENKKNSQLNFLLGLMPQAGSSGKFQLTYDVNLDLKNMFGNGEGFLLKAQQLQLNSPVFQIGYDHPYIGNSNFGVNTFFSLFKKDSSFIQINAQAGLQYVFSTQRKAKGFVQFQNNTLLSGAVDTNLIKQRKALPQDIDVRSINVGLQYDFNNTDYRFNPRRGSEIQVVSLSGLKTISKSEDILNIKDGIFNYASLYDTIKLRSYHLRLKMSGAKYFPVSKSSVFKASLSAGFYESPSVFRNELFQIGGFKLLRGFDEESIYANMYGVATAEYRQLISTNSYIFGFVDGGVTSLKYQSTKATNNFVSGGIGIFYETKAGLLNLSLAVGRRNDVDFSLRQAAKIHFGYINYF